MIVPSAMYNTAEEVVAWTIRCNEANREIARVDLYLGQAGANYTLTSHSFISTKPLQQGFSRSSRTAGKLETLPTTT